MGITSIVFTMGVLPAWIILMYLLLKHLRHADWTGCYKMLCWALGADIASTFFFVYVLGFGWRDEGNIAVQTYGPSIGFGFALVVNHACIALVAYLVGLVTYHWLNQFIPKVLYWVLSATLTLVALENIITSTTERLVGR